MRNAKRVTRVRSDILLGVEVVKVLHLADQIMCNQLRLSESDQISSDGQVWFRTMV